MKHIFIINPKAGKGDFQKSLYMQIKNVMENLNLPYDIYLTKGIGDAIRYVLESCLDNKKTRYYACGGDGTLNEVINGLVGQSDVSVTVYPCGTGNDFIKNFHTKTNFRDIKALVQAKEEKIDLLKINDRYVINICNVGFDADVAYHMNKFKNLPLINGSLAYTLAIFYCFFSKLGCSLYIENNDIKYQDNYLLAIMANGGYYGGGYYGAPLARVDDQLMDFIGIKKISRIKILKLLKLFNKGLHLNKESNLDKVIKFQQCTKLIIKSDKPVSVSMDGDIWQMTELKAKIVPQIINFAIPN